MNDSFEAEIKNEKIYQEEEIGYQSEAKRDFINSLYRNILTNFIVKRSSSENICVNKTTSLEIEESVVSKIDDEIDPKLSTEEISPEEENEEENSFLNHKQYSIFFANGNSYFGQMDKDMMEGTGSYHWRHGAQYKGEFKKNRIDGKGHLLWKDNCSWYEGEFSNSIRHGRGMMINKDFSRFYTGSWHMGYRNGSGLCHYGDQDYYDGMWVMGKRQGKGYRVYPNGSIYVGNWENDLRHGFGTMVWSNGDVYRGEWISGHMQGFGEYVWNGYFNKTLSWPRENSYMGQWYRSLRHGKGLLKLNSVGGAKYSGMWNEDMKHGFGILIGNDGSSLEMNPLFRNDILIPDEGNTESEGSQFMKKFSQILHPIVIEHLNPEQWPLLSEFMKHLTVLEEEIDDSIVEVQKCEKCNLEDEDFCNCLAESYPKEIKQTSSVENANDCNIVKRKKILEQEEIFLRQSLTSHMPRLRKIYEIYANVYCSEEKVASDLCMSRMSLWQLWRDCGIHKKNISLIQIDNLIVASSSEIFMETKHNPFESIEVWQFLLALLELSWELYSKYENSDVSRRLAGGFCKVLEMDIYSNAGNYSGKIFDFGVDFLPLAILYQLYRNIGDPHSVKELWKAVFSSDSPVENCGTLNPKIFFDGMNAKTVGSRISFIPKAEFSINSQSPSSLGECPKNRDLSAFRELGSISFLSVVSIVCPSIGDEALGSIINMDYELTFLEFYEILLEATVALLKRRKSRERKRRQIIRKSKEGTDVREAISMTSLSTRVQSRSSISMRKGEKVNNSQKKRKQKF